MSENYCSFQQLPFSNLFTTYTSSFKELERFYSTNPFEENAVEEKSKKVQSKVSREEVVRALEEYHVYLGIQDSQADQLRKFSNEDALVIVTGQQLGVYGGPLFTIYKTISCILLAREWERKLQRPVVPVFWMADEDHDFEEIASIGIPGFEGFESVSLAQDGTGLPVSMEIIQDTFPDFETRVKSTLTETDFSDSLFSELNGFYEPGKTHVQAFAQLINSIFSKEGVLIVGSNTQLLKDSVKDLFKTSITEAETIYNSLEKKSADLEKSFHRQVVVTESNLFYIDDQLGRVKLEKSGNVWKVGSLTLSQDKLLSLINANPEKFSPNVFLRPVLQDMLLPTLGYVAGPGELAYYGQMKDLYPVFDLEMPIIFPRLSITLLEKGIERIMEKLPFAMCSYNRRIEDLEATYVDHTNSRDIEGIFSKWKSEINEAGVQPSGLIKEIDQSLEGLVGKTVTGFNNELDKLKGRVYRSIKQQEETQLKRIAKIKSQLFPNGLQERSVSPIYFMNKYGEDIWDDLITRFGEEELDLTIHHIVSV
ncbi:MAG: bacillithiol biosynthesis cysteine-adding enzyme BshC [Balneola sp.]|nr:MAG: bacillithiol biosynthesis cysteine-adding enzyme BshC [Balneola sp.]